MNEFIFIGHTVAVATSAIGALFLGKEALVSFICLLGILSNLFISKQITLFGFNVTGGEVFAVGAIFGLNLLQEFFGRDVTKKTIKISFFLMFFYLAMSQLHLWYTPNSFDAMQTHFSAILEIMPRITLASVTVYFIVQCFDAHLYQRLKNMFSNNHVYLRSTLALICSQLLDTTLFTYLGLYGIIANPCHVILVSMAVKLIAIAGTTPFILLAKKVLSLRKPHG